MQPENTDVTVPSSTLEALRDSVCEMPIAGLRHAAFQYRAPAGAGGQSRATLERCALFAQVFSQPPEIMTFAVIPDMEAMRETIASRGLLPESTTIRNLWEDLQDEALVSSLNGAVGPDDETPSVPPLAQDVVTRTLGTAGGHRTVQHVDDSEGKLVRSDLFRLDGSRYASQILDGEATPGFAYDDAYFVYDHANRVIGMWKSQSALLYDWLDVVLGDDAWCLISDDQVGARALFDYERPNVMKMAVLHSAHVIPPNGPYVGEIRARNRPLLREMAKLDSFVVLTERQRKDIALRFGATENLTVIPNSTQAFGEPSNKGRDPLRVVGLYGNMLRLKQIDHAIRGIKVASSLLGKKVHFDIYGSASNPAQQKYVSDLEGLAAYHGLADQVVYRGHRPDALKEFETSTAMLLTSRYEGQPKVIIEAMARGCIPIVYECNYGPSDLVQSGVSGIVVPQGDHMALGREIAALVSMDEFSRERIRRAAWRHSIDYSEPEVAGRWVTEIVRAWERRAERCDFRKAELVQLDSTRDGDQREVRGCVTIRGQFGRRTREILHASLVWLPTAEAVPYRVRCATSEVKVMGETCTFEFQARFTESQLYGEFSNEHLEVVCSNSVIQIPILGDFELMMKRLVQSKAGSVLLRGRVGEALLAVAARAGLSSRSVRRRTDRLGLAKVNRVA